MWGAFSRERSDLQNLAKAPGHACRGFLADESGATAIEYGLIAAIVCSALIAALTNFSAGVIAMYNYIVASFQDAANQS
jgi:pilus assembly protein Flp/PilA